MARLHRFNNFVLAVAHLLQTLGELRGGGTNQQNRRGFFLNFSAARRCCLPALASPPAIKHHRGFNGAQTHFSRIVVSGFRVVDEVHPLPGANVL